MNLVGVRLARLWALNSHCWRNKVPLTVGPSSRCLAPAACCIFQRTYAKKVKRPSIGEEEEAVVDFEGLSSAMVAAVNALKWEYTNTIVTRLTPASLNRVSVQVEGRVVPLRQVAQIGMPSPQTLVVNMASYPQAVDAAVKALRGANLNLNPVSEKAIIKVPIPKMTKELRENLVKLAKAHAERTKVGIRKVRQRGIAEARRSEDQVSEDTIHRAKKHIQHLTDTHTKVVDELLKAKSAELIKS